MLALLLERMHSFIIITATANGENMFDQTQIRQLIQAAEQAWYACPHQTCFIRGCPNEQTIAHHTRKQKKCFKFLIKCLMAFKFYQTRPPRSNTIKQHQTISQTMKCLVFKHAVQFGNNWMKKIPRTAKIGRGHWPSPIWLSGVASQLLGIAQS